MLEFHARCGIDFVTNIDELTGMTTYASALEAVEQLSIDEQEDLVDTVRRRLIEKRRAEVISEVDASREEARSGKAKPASPEEIMRMIRE